jgi:hypothetical protein
VVHSLGRPLPDPIRRAVFERVARVVVDLGLDGSPGDLFEERASETVEHPRVRFVRERVLIRSHGLSHPITQAGRRARMHSLERCRGVAVGSR